jgi:hypothetical protein
MILYGFRANQSTLSLYMPTALFSDGDGEADGAALGCADGDGLAGAAEVAAGAVEPGAGEAPLPEVPQANRVNTIMTARTIAVTFLIDLSTFRFVF